MPRVDARQSPWLENAAYVSLTGTIDALDESVIYFRLSDDCVIMLEADTSAFRRGDWLQIRVLRIALEVC
ncbi:MAG: hypothetical protein M3Y87_01645 [Myxococcota bacterium]|nr:hypothetical protein [Myxococcota bacterium]